MGAVQEKMWPHVLWDMVPQVPGAMLVAFAGHQSHHLPALPCSHSPVLPSPFQLYLVSHPLGIGVMPKAGWY